jgi:hypothetical protein
LTLGVYARDIMNTIELRDVISGLIKSLAFASIIVQVGCLEGFRVRGGPDVVGRSTTSAIHLPCHRRRRGLHRDLLLHWDALMPIISIRDLVVRG